MLEPAGAGLVVWALPIGARLADRYRIQEKLGEGGMACVYRAHDEVDETTVALKVLDPLRGADPVGRARFEQEFKILGRLSHPGVARAIRAARHGELEILVLEYLEGETLQTRLTRGPLPVASAISMGRRLAETVAACHTEGILHRDLKPANVMLHPDRGPIVLDFGVAWFSAAATLTRTGAVIGSPQYIAPEVLRSSVADARADVFALGVIVFEMLTGAPPYAEDVRDPTAWSRPATTPTVFSRRPEAGTEISAIVGRAMADRPEDRYATASELEAALTRSATVSTGRTLQASLPCPGCGTSRIIDLPVCPGCGAPVAWSLNKGAYAVQLDRITDVDATTDWLYRRHADAIRLGTAPLLKRRLKFQPVPLAVGISQTSAVQLAAEVREVGAEASVVQSQALLGTRLKASEASTSEALIALVTHFIATVGTAALLLAFGVPSTWMPLLPALFGVIGVGAVVTYTRRPVLRIVDRGGHAADLTERTRRVTSELGELAHERSRHLAAQSFSRAAPVLLSAAASDELKDDVERALGDAIAAVRRADVHQSFLLDNPRHDLTHELESARARVAQGSPGAIDALTELEHRKRSITDASVAYDVEVRRALELCERISGLTSALVALPSARNA